MGKVTIYLHRKTQDFADFVSVVLDTSRSEVIEDMIKYVRDEELEKEVWGDEWKEGLDALEEAGEAEEEEGEEEGESEESEEEEEEEESEEE